MTPALLSIAIAWFQAQILDRVSFPAITWPSVKKSAAETIRPAARRSSLVFAANLKRNSMNPSYQFRLTKAVHLPGFRSVRLIAAFFPAPCGRLSPGTLPAIQALLKLREQTG